MVLVIFRMAKERIKHWHRVPETDGASSALEISKSICCLTWWVYTKQNLSWSRGLNWELRFTGVPGLLQGCFLFLHSIWRWKDGSLNKMHVLCTSSVANAVFRICRNTLRLRDKITIFSNFNKKALWSARRWCWYMRRGQILALGNGAMGYSLGWKKFSCFTEKWFE